MTVIGTSANKRKSTARATLPPRLLAASASTAVVATLVFASPVSAATVEGSPISTIGAPTTSVPITVSSAAPVLATLAVPSDVDPTVDPVVTTSDTQRLMIVGGAFSSDGTGYNVQIVNPDPTVDAQGAVTATWSGRILAQFESGAGQQLRVPAPSEVDTSTVPAVTPDDGIDISIDQVGFSSDGTELLITLTNTSEVPVSTYYTIGWVTTLAVTADRNPGTQVTVPAPPGNVTSSMPQISVNGSASLQLVQAEYNGAETDLLVGVANTDPSAAVSGSVDVIFTAPYGATSPTVSVGSADYTDPYGYSCQEGYDAASQPVKTHGDYIKEWSFAHLLPFTGSDGKSYYNAFQVAYVNESLLSSHDAWATWECVPRMTGVDAQPSVDPPADTDFPVEADPGRGSRSLGAGMLAESGASSYTAAWAAGGAGLFLAGALLLSVGRRRPTGP